MAPTKPNYRFRPGRARTPKHPVRHPFALPVDEYGTPVRLGPSTPRADARRLTAAEDRGEREGKRERAEQVYDARRRVRTLQGS